MRKPWPALAAAAMVLLVPALAFADGGDFEKYQQKGWVWMYLASFGFGFVTSLTPCVYPMIPITLAIFGARGKNVSRRRALALATSYVVGMGLTYAVLGVVFALLGDGTGFGSQLANPFLVIPLVLLFVALAASMFGAFDINLPASWQARLNQVGGKGFGGAFAMGLVGGLIAAPCTGPFLAGLLAFVSTTGSVVGGGSLLFVYALGMGVLFWVLAAFAMSLPKSGNWMEGVKSSGGILMLVAALYFLRPLMPWMRRFASPDTWFVVASIVIGVAGIALGAIHLSFHGSRVDKSRKGVGVALVLAGIFGAWTWWMTPKKHLPWITDEQVAYERARAEGKGVMVDFAATWCEPCEKLEMTFGDDDVYDAITKSFVPLKIDVSRNDDDDMDKRGRYGATTLPSVVFLSSDHTIAGRTDKFLEPDEMIEIVGPAIKLAQAHQAPVPGALAWVNDERRAFDQAKSDHKGVLVAFDADWCGPCKELNQQLANDQVKPVIQSSFIPLKLDVTNDTDANQKARTRYGASSLPALVFVSTDGTVLGRVTELSDAPRLLGVIQPAAAKLRN